jgi:hypothetical protein
MTKKGIINTIIGKHKENIGDAMLYKLITCKKEELLFMNFAKSQSIYKYLLQKQLTITII